MAAITLIEVHPPRLENDVRRLQSRLEQTRAHMERLRESMEALNRMWEGPANQAVRQRFREDYERMQALCKSIEEWIMILESIRRAYDECENQVRDTVYELRI